jgi:hypothetical protein
MDGANNKYSLLSAANAFKNFHFSLSNFRIDKTTSIDFIPILVA